MDAGPDLQPHTPRSKIIPDSARIEDGASKAVELRHNERIAAAHSGQRLVKAGPCTLCAGEAVIGVDTIHCNAELLQGILLSGEVLLVRRAASIANERVRHARICNVKGPFIAINMVLFQ